MKLLQPLLLTAVLLCFGSPLPAQTNADIDVTWSNTIKLGFKGATTRFVGEFDDHLYLISDIAPSNAAQISNKVTFLKFNSKMRKVDEASFELDYPDGDRIFAGTFTWNDELYLMSRRKDDEKFHLYVQTIDQSTLEPTDNGRKLLTAVGKSGLLSMSINGHFRYYTSPDSTKLVIGFLGSDSDKSYQFWVLDDEFNVKWSKSKKLPNDDDYEVEDYAITNSGNVFMLVDETDEGGLFSSADYSYSVTGFFENGEVKKTFSIGKQDHVFTNPHIAALENGRVGITGCFKNTEKEHILGTFFISLDEQTREKTASEYNAFDVDLLAFGNGDGAQRKIKRRFKKGKAVGLDPITTRKVIKREDGGIVVSGEEQASVSYNSGSGSSSTHDFGDIYVVSYNPDGSIDWRHKIPKIQRTSGGLLTSMSFAMVPVNDKICILFNDNEKNVNYQGPGNPKTAVIDAAILMVTIDGKGNVTRRIADEMNGNLYYLTSPTTKFGDNKVFLMSQKMGKFKFGTLELEDI